ncbi:MAG: response regulator transcription factor [Nocardioides sp.]
MVDDEPAILEAVKRGLGAEGMAVDTAANGIDGLWKATNAAYDVVVLDVMLPGLSGYDVLRRMREAEVWTPVLMLTARDGEYDVADALDLGADDYLMKPFSFVVLLARVRALQRRGVRARPAVLTAGDLVIDPAARTCTRGETEVALTPKEFAVLEFLANHPDQVMSKTAILQGVWDEHFDGDSNVVEVYIGYLRRKIDAPFGRQSIGTVRGVGYRLRGDGG